MLLLFWLTTIAATAQIARPVKWHIYEIVDGTTLTITLTASISDGWHIYSTEPMGEYGPQPTEVRFTTLQGLELTGALQVTRGKILKQRDDAFGMVLSFYEDGVTLQQKARITDNSYKAEGYVRFMACNDQQCTAPTTIDFSFAGSPKSVTSNRPSAPGSDIRSLRKSVQPSGYNSDSRTYDNRSNYGNDRSSYERDYSSSSDYAPYSSNSDAPSDAAPQPSASAADSLIKADSIRKALAFADSIRTADSLRQAAALAAAADSSSKVIVASSVENAENSGSEAAHKWWYILLAGMAAGFVALITPCVWPMIPMTVSFFLKRTKDRSRSIRDAIIYGLSIIIIYVGLGLLITMLFGASALNSLATSALFNLFFFLLLVLFALSFFGAFELTLPASWTTKLDAKADSLTADSKKDHSFRGTLAGLLAIFFMAFTLALVSFSCTGPIIGTLLVEAATSGSMLYPAIGMFGFALALSIPFTLFAVFPSMLKSMPRSGNWLNSVKVVLGFLELALSLKFLSVADLAYGWNILDRETFLALWIVIFFMLGLYLLGKIRLPHDDDPSPSDRVSTIRLMLAIASWSFAVYMLPGLWGAPCKAISAFTPPMSTQDFNLLNEAGPVVFHDYDEGMAEAQRLGRPVLLDFSGFGCVNCRKMEASVWPDAKVKSLLADRYAVIQLMVDDKTPLPGGILTVMEEGEEVRLRTFGDQWSHLQRTRFGANAQPYYVVLDHSGSSLCGSFSFSDDASEFAGYLQTGLDHFQALSAMADATTTTAVDSVMTAAVDSASTTILQ